MSFFNKFFSRSKCNCLVPCDSGLTHSVVSTIDSLFPFFRFVFSKVFLTVIFMFFLIFSFLVNLSFYSPASSSPGNLPTVGSDYSLFYTDSSQKLYDSLLSSELVVNNTSASSANYFENFQPSSVIVSEDLYPSFSSSLPNGSYTGFVEFYDVIFSLDKSRVSCLFVLNVSNSVSVSSVSYPSSRSSEGLIYAYGFSDMQCPVSEPKYASFTVLDGEAFLSSFFVF